MAHHSTLAPTAVAACKPHYGSLGAWRTALFAALGLGAASGCGGATNPDAPPEPKWLCEDPNAYPVLANEPQDTGFVACRGHWYHRSERKECPSVLPRADVTTGYQGDTCQDSSCTERPHGFCTPLGGIGPTSVACVYGCVRDDECRTGEICLCGDPVGTCVRATCQTDADCPGSLCVGTPNPAACGPGDVVFFGCADPKDECVSGSQCDQGLSCESSYDPTKVEFGPRKCDYGPVCGRPFLVSGAARLAGTEAGVGWLSEHANPNLRALNDALRATLAQHWTEIARMEHASVAAFARFVLELLAAGAPAALVCAAQQALGDEIEHARLCFGLASVYAGAPLGPGPLDTRGVLADAGLFATVRAAIHEACVGETLAAAEARDALEGATDPAVRAVLQTVVRDEGAHAELGWKFLHWALDGASTDLRELARIELARAIESALRSRATLTGTEHGASELACHGLSPERRRRAAGRAAIEQLVIPLSRAILDHTTGAGSASTQRSACAASASLASFGRHMGMPAARV